jgi:hypothetical protein
MATITLKYDACSVQAQKRLGFILSTGIFSKKEKIFRLLRFEEFMFDI